MASRVDRRRNGDERAPASRVEIPKQVGAARQRLADITAELQTSAAGDDNSPQGAAARR